MIEDEKRKTDTKNRSLMYLMNCLIDKTGHQQNRKTIMGRKDYEMRFLFLKYEIPFAYLTC